MHSFPWRRLPRGEELCTQYRCLFIGSEVRRKSDAVEGPAFVSAATALKAFPPQPDIVSDHFRPRKSSLNAYQMQMIATTDARKLLEKKKLALW
jgi:hypothetical protein